MTSLLAFIWIINAAFGQPTCVTDDIWDDMCNVDTTNWVSFGNVFPLQNCDKISDCCVGMSGNSSDTITTASTLTNEYCLSNFDRQVHISMSLSIKFVVNEYISLQYKCGNTASFDEFKRFQYQGNTNKYFTFHINHKISCDNTNTEPFFFRFETKTFNADSYAKISNFEICNGTCDQTKKTVLIIILCVWLGLLCFCLCFCCFICWDEANEARMAEEKAKQRKKEYEKRRKELIKQEQRKKQKARYQEYIKLKAEHDKRIAAQQKETIKIPVKTAKPNVITTQVNPQPKVVQVQPNVVRVQPNVIYQPIQTVQTVPAGQQPIYGYPQNYVVYNQP